MSDVIYKHIYDLDKTGIQIHYYSHRGEYSPPHFHSALEMHYALNGVGEIILDGKKHALVNGEFILVDSDVIHQIQCANISMGLYIYVSRDFLKRYVPDLDILKLNCTRESLQREKLGEYLTICEMMKELPRLYITQPRGYEMRCESIVMEVLFILVNHFSQALPGQENLDESDVRVRERLAEILSYISEHYREDISLEEISGKFGLSREYFCRFFKKYMGVTFVRHLHLVRLVHIHDDILNTQDNIMDIAFRNGFSNYKLFTKLFREIYGCVPSELRNVQVEDRPVQS